MAAKVNTVAIQVSVVFLSCLLLLLGYLDVVTTREGLLLGTQEAEPVMAWVFQQLGVEGGTQLGFFLLFVLACFLAYVNFDLYQMRHERMLSVLAIAVLVVLVALEGYAVVNNFEANSLLR